MQDNSQQLKESIGFSGFCGGCLKNISMKHWLFHIRAWSHTPVIVSSTQMWLQRFGNTGYCSWVFWNECEAFSYCMRTDSPWSAFLSLRMHGSFLKPFSARCLQPTSSWALCMRAAHREIVELGPWCQTSPSDWLWALTHCTGACWLQREPHTLGFLSLNLLHSVQSASILLFPVRTILVPFFTQLPWCSCSLLWNTGHGTPEHCDHERTGSFEQADKELCFSPFGSVCVTPQSSCPVALPWVQSLLCCPGLSWNNQSNTRTASAASGSGRVPTHRRAHSSLFSCYLVCAITHSCVEVNCHKNRREKNMFYCCTVWVIFCLECVCCFSTSELSDSDTAFLMCIFFFWCCRNIETLLIWEIPGT